jgi:hypothetical protein
VEVGGHVGTLLTADALTTLEPEIPSQPQQPRTNDKGCATNR